MLVSATVESPIIRSFRLDQLASLFDVSIDAKATRAFTADIPDTSENWSIGVICGPSGSGKSTLASQAYGQTLWRGAEWPHDGAVIEGFGPKRDIHEIVGMMTSVGFSSPPSWIVPYRVLSNGEKFRADLARAMLDSGDVLCYDEFSSVVDRTVAKIGSAAVAKAARRMGKRFVAVTCHRDVVEWLEPDWVLDTATMELARGSLQRPPIQIEVFPCKNEAWGLFRKFHYLDSSLHRSAQCYLATWNGEPVGFCATLHSMGMKGMERITRVVVLPDYQGIGIGGRLTDEVAKIRRGLGKRVAISGSHPGVLLHCKKSPAWSFVGMKKIGSQQSGVKGRKITRSMGRSIASFEYIGG